MEPDLATPANDLPLSNPTEGGTTHPNHLSAVLPSSTSGGNLETNGQVSGQKQKEIPTYRQLKK
ncbi:hypothetical protein PV05_12059 [Exophiala xenobiotica]|uniref:Uncharacterized protein n=1 Tax=Exophiala xenobiotica TaxID=348802 RepID=A0A0D2E4Y7_9EURO|nr:uncharacterized protein PV05_12059 [Exophiala xenobiotica]KIW50473.1 hypothetical protein PV05_12059 [Exophiala xenobiotica]